MNVLPASWRDSISGSGQRRLKYGLTPSSYPKMTKVTLDVIYEELRRLNRRMDILEELMEEIILRELPRVKLSEREIDEIKKSVEEIRKGECATLEGLLNA